MSGPGVGGGVTVMGGTINDSPWGNMEITDATASTQSTSLSSNNKSNNRSNTYVARATPATEVDHDFLLQEPEISNDITDDDMDEDDECCLGCCSRRRWRMRFLHLGSLVDFLLGVLLLTYGGILAHSLHCTSSSSTPPLDVVKVEQVLCGALLWTGILFGLRCMFLTLAVTCQRMSRRAGGIDAYDVGCCQAGSLIAVLYLVTPLLLGTFILSSAASAIFHKPLLECLSLLLQEIQKQQQEHEAKEAPSLAFTTRYLIVPILEFSVQHSHWIWFMFLVLTVIEYLRRKLYVWHYEDVYQQEEASMVPSWQRRPQREGENGNGGRRPRRFSFMSPDGRPWWWDRSRSFTRRRRHGGASQPPVGNENLTEALLQDEYVNTGRLQQSPTRSPQGSRRRRRGAWWRLFSRNSDDEDADHDNIRDDGSVDFASVQEEWEIRSQGNPTWWAQDDDDANDNTDLSWAEQQQRR